MTTKAYALTDDQNGRFREAATGYEAVLRSEPRDLETIVNLAVLYWQTADGPHGQKGAPPSDFTCHARSRMYELLDSAGRLFAEQAEIRFWKRYIAAAESGTRLEPGECRALMCERPGYIEPAFVVFANSDGLEAEPEAMRLLADYAEQPTARARYVTSIISAALRKQRWNPSPPRSV